MKWKVGDSELFAPIYSTDKENMVANLKWSSHKSKRKKLYKHKQGNFLRWSFLVSVYQPWWLCVNTHRFIQLTAQVQWMSFH